MPVLIKLRIARLKFNPPLMKVTLIKRYKRFLADVIDEEGRTFTIHCPNTGSMKNCMEPGRFIWLSLSSNAKRKYAHTWELAETPAGDIAGVNTGRSNRLVEEAIVAGMVFDEPVLNVRREVAYGEEKSRIDLLVSLASGDCFVEVKNLTLMESSGNGFFPDSPSARGAKHLRELARIVDSGGRAMLFYCVQHSGIEQVAPARHIDPVYAAAFDEAKKVGVEFRAFKAQMSPKEVVLEKEIPVVDDLPV